MPSRDGMNLSRGGKVYDHNNGWLAFQKSPSVSVTRTSAIGKLITKGDIVVGKIKWPKNYHIGDLVERGGKNWEDLPDNTDAKKFLVMIDHSEWEKEIIKTEE